MGDFENFKVKLYKLDANSAVHNANAQIKIYEKRLDDYDAKMIACRPLSKVIKIGKKSEMIFLIFSLLEANECRKISPRKESSRLQNAWETYRW